MKTIHLRALWGLFLLAATALGQELPTVRLKGLFDPSLWIHFDESDGLPSNRVLRVYDNPWSTASHIWVATEKGIAWYDGYRWHPAQSEQGMLGEEISDLAVDSDGTVLALRHYRGWIGAAGKPFKPLEEVDVAGGERIRACAPIPGGGIAYLVQIPGARRAELRRLGDPKDAPVRLDTQSFRPSVLRPDASGETLWIACRSGLRRMEGWGRWKLMAEAPGVTVSAITALNGRSGGLAYVQSPWQQRGLWEWTASGEFRHLAQMDFDGINGLSMRPDGEAILALQTGQIRLRLDGHWGVLDPLPPQMRNANDLCYRRDGGLWVATSQGLYLWRREHPYWKTLEHGTDNRSSLVLEYLHATDGTLWVGKSRGLEGLRPDGSTLRFTEVDHTELRSITALGEDREGNIWFASGSGCLKGAMVWNGKTFRHEGAAQGLDLVSIHRIRKDRSGDLWFLGLSDDPNDVTVPQPGIYHQRADGTYEVWDTDRGLPSGRVYDFIEAPNGDLWFATYAGIARFRDGTMRVWTQEQGLRSGRVFTLALDDDGTLWFGHQTSGRGLGRIDPDDSVHYQIRDPSLAQAKVNIVRCTPGHDGLWVGTDRGLFLYDSGTWTRFSSESGLKNDKIQALLVEPTEVCVGTYGGGTHLLRLPEPAQPPPVVDLLQPALDGRRALLRWHVHTWWGDPLAAHVLTRFRLDQNPWSPWSTDREALLPDLSYGDHRFEVQAKDYFGDHKPQGSTVAVLVPLPFHLQPLVLIPLATVLLLSTGLTTLLLHRRHRGRRRVAESEERFRQLAESINEVFWLTAWPSGRILYISPAYTDVTGAPTQEIYAQANSWERYVHPDDQEKAVAGFFKEAAEGRYDVEFRILPRDGGTRWVRARAFPIRNARGEVYRIAGIAEDITITRLATQALARSEARYRELLETIPDALVLLRDERVIFANSAAITLFHCGDSSRLHGATIRELLDDVGTRRLEDYLRQPDEGSALRHIEAQAVQSSGQHVDVEISCSRVELEGDFVVQIMLRDISERVRAQARQTRLVRELDHRVKNSLAGVLALAQQTLRRAGSLEDFERAFHGRLQAMARTHELLAASHWEAVPMVDLIRMVVAPYTTSSKQLELDGPYLEVGASAVAPLGMALHELATNAAKYGALRGDEGVVRVSWNDPGDESLHLCWQERTSLSATPIREGLGTSIVRGVIEYELDGNACSTLQPSGIRWDLSIPYSRLQRARGSIPA